MTIRDLRRPRTPHVVTPLEVWREEFTATEKLLVLPAVLVALAGLWFVLSVIFGGWG